MTISDFELPDVGEGLTEAEIVQWHVRPGEPVALNQVLVEIETAKSLVELPSPFEGVIGELRAAEGDTVEVGSVILTVQGAGASDAPDDGAPVAADTGAGAGNEVDAEFESARADASSTIAAAETAEAAADEKPGSVLVGYGVGKAPTTRRKRRTAGGSAASDGAGRDFRGAGAEATKSALAAQTRASRSNEDGPRRLASVPAASAQPVIAKPPIRKLARDLGVDLAQVEPTGLAGETTRDDVLRSAHQASVFKNLETPEPGPVREERHPVKGVRKAIANAMVSSMFTAPHVTLFVDVDATRTMEYVKRLKSSPDFAGVKVSPLLLVAKAVVWAIRRNPTTNAAWTDEEYTIKHYVNLGIAAATPRGLIVPNIKDVNEMSMRQLASAIEQLTLRARDGKTPPSEQQGGTFTITNIGVFGMDSGTPILNPGEVGILALGTIKPKPWVVGDEVQVRQVTTLTASFDHRLVDGDVASRFLADVATIVEEPALLLD
ncbi:2-oxo acid dehydrogenase subunit E2 [Pseudoclavibacter chungangensis]|uniref:Dihydrolipoamide acetyltransferase component of pyruvate dehydrogenase complex n=1 Tax=Pseudoclavibacter chungangensis TaxID=587635 RepID=A0A7J5BMT5_9MICO|nr:dihydrolipoamide acetyltransferase family protein [Pseudoclavibacter chungangensis]KAB1652608.1 2-oxo acid dehydrogenase subunit E2 [Pseudoclavibacter chungangensis]NYJ68393.1 pyruvate dehydrogenase E2 component (dihydrolipoamide acetyltransferase) [Pseudoclavibacter chungangensis]